MGALAGLAAGEVAGLGPGGGEADPHGFQCLGAEAIRGGLGDRLGEVAGVDGGAERGLEDEGGAHSQEGIAGSRTEEGEEGVSGGVDFPEMAKAAEECQARIEAVELAELLPGPEAGGGGALAEGILVQNGGAVGSVRGVGRGGGEELGQVREHDAAAGVGAALPGAEAETGREVGGGKGVLERGDSWHLGLSGFWELGSGSGIWDCG